MNTSSRSPFAHDPTRIEVDALAQLYAHSLEWS